MKAAERGRAVPWLALGTAAAAWALSSGSAELQVRCALTPGAVAAGELWRLWTGHLVHFGGAHLRGDVLAFALWATLIERQSRGLLGGLLLVAPPLLSLVILIGCPELGEYRGLSALDCSLVVALIGLRGVSTERLRGVGVACLLAFAAKCGYEFWSGRAILAPDLGRGVRLLPLAHVAGGVLGLLAVLAYRSTRSRASPCRSERYGSGHCAALSATARNTS